MDVLDEDILKVWKILNRFDVKYIMIGGFAVNLHGFHRATEDMDLWILDTLENRKKLRTAFIDLDIGDFKEIETIDFIAGWTEFRVSNYLRLDLMSKIPGLEQIGFEECLKMASIAEIEGIKVPFLHLNHLIEAKKATASPKDLIDIEELIKIRNIINTENI